MGTHIVATVDEIPPGSRKVVTVERRSIGVFNVDGSYYAIRNQCPHGGGPLCDGRVTGFVSSPTPGEYVYQRQGEILRCPWHGWEFDITTGQSWFDPATTRVHRYDASVASGGELAGLSPGPYVAETYDIRVDEQYV
ncbi:MAG TPA: Rieske (2Fe-2S) protein, partial [Mycobacteriales bacterium]|nr:Rieske (2Fe-2S) protein [Mycobacteriales bacterium]